jgi:predicted transposase YbfD/YdcC
MKIGSAEYPIQLKKEHDTYQSITEGTAERNLLHKFTIKSESRLKGGHLTSEDFDEYDDPGFRFSYVKKDEIGYELFMSNIISNPHLPVLCMRVAIALYLLLDNVANNEDVFITTSRKLNYDEIGDDGFVYIGKSSEDFLINEDSRLTQILNADFNLDIPTKVLNKVLDTLHSFHYITVTDISPDNLHKNAKEQWNKENKNKKTGKKKFRACVKHIRLNSLLREISLIHKWLPKDVGKTIRKAEKIDKGYI